jgi:hypothetical protein
MVNVVRIWKHHRIIYFDVKASQGESRNFESAAAKAMAGQEQKAEIGKNGGTPPEGTATPDGAWECF